MIKELTAIIASAILFITGIIFEKSLHSYPLAEYGLFLTAYAVAGWKVVLKAVKNIKRGSDAAIETADIVIMDDKISKIPKAIRLSRRTQSIVWQNIAFVLAVKGLFVSLGALGLATIWEAVFADVGTYLITTLNAMRVFR